MDDDGIVEVVNDAEIVQPATSSVSFVFGMFGSAISFIESYGWFILAAAIVLYYLYTRFGAQVGNLTTRATDKPLDEKKELERLQNLEAARAKQQAAFNASKERFLEEKKLKEEQLAKQAKEEWELHQQGLGYKNKLKSTTPNQEEELAKLGLKPFNADAKKKPKMRPSDYNPLTGSSSSSSGDANVCYRPSKRGGGASQGG